MLKSPCCHFLKEDGEQQVDSWQPDVPPAPVLSQVLKGHATSLFRGEKRGGPTGMSAVLHLELTAAAASLQPTVGDPMLGWV